MSAADSSLDSDPQRALCAKCFEGYLLDGQPKGHLEKTGPIESYVAVGKKTAEDGKVIVLATDIFGLGIPNSKLLADKLAAELGWTVYVPDLFEGDYIDTSKLQPQLELMDESLYKKSLFSKITSILSILYGIVRYVGLGYVKKHSLRHALTLSEQVCSFLRTEKGVKKIGMVGYCFGGGIAVLLATKAGPIDVGVSAHPGQIKAEDFKTIARPFALLLPEEDWGFDRIKKDAVANLDGLAVPKVVHNYPDTLHGFACRPKLSDPNVKAQFHQALADTCAWFKEHL
ncbi:hypothetical protein JCM1841_005596 [Sporobolomyces salmonicolor]